MTEQRPGATEGFGGAWLEAATTGGLPEPARSRWQPLRVGIVNLWEYDEAEFWFADGRLVLRGGNGAGKTKVLELTTLILLRGEITPAALDPFGSQHRTMRYNLLPTGEGDDPREPADSGLGYAWVEFGRRDDSGQPRFFVCGMGASARRGSGTGGTTPWHFVTTRRPGKDFTLLHGGRALELKDLKKVDGVSTPPSATAYRARLASELFELSGESYDNLTELLKQLRKPKLGERLNPTVLTDILRDALPPLATHEVTQLAEGWEHLEQVRRAVEQTEQAATAVAEFVRSGWRPWARILLRRRADEFVGATTDLDNTTRKKNEASEQLERNREEVHAAGAGLERSEAGKRDNETQLRELLVSPAYQGAQQDAARAEWLRAEVTRLEKQCGQARGQLSTEQEAARKAAAAASTAREAVEAADARVREVSENLTGLAEPAGLADSAARYLPERDIDALSSDCAVREERFDHLQGLHGEHNGAARKAESSGEALQRAQRDHSRAREQEDAAAGAVQRHAESLDREVQDWAAAATVATTTQATVAQWCDLVAGLTIVDEETGRAQPGRSVTVELRAHVTATRAELTAQREAVMVRRAPLHERRERVAAELAAARERTETVPPAPATWRRRERPGTDAELGAPLWRAVNPAADLSDAGLALLEASLAAAGLLDAWLSPDGTLSTVDGNLVADVQVPVDGNRQGRTLATVLEPATAGGVPAETVRRVLDGIGWLDTAHAGERGDWLAADGGWRIGGLAGRAEPAGPASYLGAAAREAARLREIERLETELAELEAQLAELDGQLAGIAERVATLDAEERAIPDAAERELTGLTTTLAERARRRLEAARERDAKQAEHDADLTRRDEAWARFADYATTHRFGLHDLAGQAAALRGFRDGLAAVTGALELLAVRTETHAHAAEAETERAAARDDAAERLAAAEDELRTTRVRLSTAESAIGEDSRGMLRRRDELDGDIERLAGSIRELSSQLTDARVAAATAEEVLNGHERRRAEAETTRDGTLAALWAAVDGGLAEPVGLAAPQRRSVASARELAASARKELAVQAGAAEEERAWRRCYERMQELRQRLLPTRDARVLDDREDGTIQRVAVLADPDAGWRQPDRAADALAERVIQQRENYDAEQQRVLTTLLGSTFIEHLKDRLDYTAHTFARINDQLASHPTRHGNAVRVLWEADPGDPDASAVVAALGRGYEELSTERQDMVRSFLARKIDEARGDAAADGAPDWKDELARALDYRRWLRLSLQRRAGSGSTWTTFDAAKHAAKSGGEKVVLLSQPLFAAAVVAYDAAGANAPRWVWLDEAMTGVDAAIKASFMGLTVDFELDVMLTAHDEWCKYPTVPAVAVYDLYRHEHLPGVDVMPYLWCGGELTAVDAQRLGVAPDDGSMPADGLFGEYGDGSD